MNRFTQHLRDAVLEQIKSDNIEPSQYENVGAILIFVMNGLSASEHRRKTGTKQIDVIAAVVADGVHGLHLPAELNRLQEASSAACFCYCSYLLCNYPAPQGWALASAPSFAVHGDQSKLHGIALSPLKVVHQTPMEVSLHRDAVGTAVLHAIQCLPDKRHTAGIIGGGNAVFGHDQVTLESSATLRMTCSSACG